MADRGPAPGSRRGPQDPYGLLPRTGLLAPTVAAVLLLVIAIVTGALFAGWIPVSLASKSTGTGNGNGNGGSGGGQVQINATPAPSNVVVIDPRAKIPGSLVYVKAGNVWIQTAGEAKQLTSSGGASSATWSPDGQWIYYIQSNVEHGYFPQSNSGPALYTEYVPTLTRISPDGQTSQPLLTGNYRKGRYTWFSWLIDPAVSPDGKTVALFSDAPNPTNSDVVLQLFNTSTKKLTKPNLGENPPYGHQDAAWRPDGKLLLYVRNGRDGSRGVPQIWTYNPATGKGSALGAPGYMHPAWSPDGRYIAATRQTPEGTDVAILDARTGAEVLRLTNDGNSWAPVWSPRGDAIAYLHITGQIVDLRMIGLAGTGPSWTVSQLPDVTEYSGLDASSGASWYIPPDQLPATPAPTTPSPSPASPGSSSSSAGPTPSPS
jgi:dipeptidyl aminopeptidase/acylaminoacyl peptidase